MDERIESLIMIIEDDLKYIDHWDGKGLSKESLEAMIGGIQWDLELILTMLKEIKKYG